MNKNEYGHLLGLLIGFIGVIICLKYGIYEFIWKCAKAIKKLIPILLIDTVTHIIYNRAIKRNTNQ